MYTVNGRFQQTGRDKGRSLGFYGVGGVGDGEVLIPACDPTNDVNCLLSLPPIDADISNSSVVPRTQVVQTSTPIDFASWFNFGPISTGSTPQTVQAKPASSNMNLLLIAIGATALLFMLKPAR